MKESPAVRNQPVRVLLTGAAGFIGSHVAEALLARGDEVVGLDSFTAYYDPALKRRNLQVIAGDPRFRLVEGDIRDAGLVASLLEGGRIDAVLHLAACAGVRPSIDDPALYADVNVSGTTVVVEQAARAGVRRLACASSSSVYGMDSTPPFRTSARADRPVSPYAASKRGAELMCEALATLHGLGIASLRYFTVYGPRQRPDMAISKFIRAVDAGEPLTLFGDGSSRRDFTYVDDAVSATLGALDWTRPGAGHRPFNIGGASTIELSGLLAAVERATGRSAVVVRDADQPGDVLLTHADVSETREVLGWEPRVALDEGLRRQVAWFRSLARLETEDS